jgi:hypothetical protein
MYKKIKDIGKTLPKVSHELVAEALGAEMSIHTFTIWFDTTESEEDLAEKLYESGCDDSLCGVSNGVHYIDFDRKAHSINEAICTAIGNIISSGLDIRITSITTHPLCSVDDCNTVADFCKPNYWCDKHWNEWWNWDESVKGPEPKWMKNPNK